MEEAQTLLAAARSVVVLTGAGVSAESGIPTFRGDEGLWKSYRPERLATPEAFASDPRLVWEWYAWRRELVATRSPHSGHVALARLCQDRPGVRLVTQNVDGLHARAASEIGSGAAPPLELHGSLFRVRCTACRYRAPHTASVDSGTVETLPRCPECGGLLRPAVVWFGESLDAAVVAEAFRAAEEAEVCLVVGTSAVVQPAAALPLSTLRTGGAVIEVNPVPTPLSQVAEVVLRGPAGELLPPLVEGALA